MQNDSLQSDFPSNERDTLYFDGQCPLCAHEMSLLRKFKTNRLTLVDVHHLDDSERGDNRPSSDEMLRVLHLRTRDGEWLRGVDANVAAWSHTRIGFLWKALKLPGIAWIANKVYYPWAERRYQRLYCSVSS